MWSRRKIGFHTPLINFIENQLARLKAPTETSTASSQVKSVASSTTLAAQIIDKISTEAGTFTDSEIAKAIGSTVVSAAKLIGETHWIFLPFSTAAYALERCVFTCFPLGLCFSYSVYLEEVTSPLLSMGYKFHSGLSRTI